MEHCFLPEVTISLDALLHNLSVIRTYLPETVSIIAVVKDAAYGCGSVAIARTLAEASVNFFAVASAHEALLLRQHGIYGDIIIFGKVSRDQFQLAAKHDCIVTLSDPHDLDLWQSYGIPFRYHLEIDTGMSRMGVLPAEIPDLIRKVTVGHGLKPEGLFTHMACADEPDTLTVDTQRSVFASVVAQFHGAGIYPEVLHTANSAAIFRFDNSEYTHIRPGIALYGCQPDPSQTFTDALEPVLSLCGKVVSLRNVPAGTPVSYGGHYTTKEATSIATIAIGYAHGVPRFLSNKGSVLIGGKRYRIAGNVTMDYIMIDCGRYSPVQPGDEAIIIGKQGAERITPDDIALLGNTIGYEILCNISSTIRRSYIRHDNVVHHQDAVSF